MHNKFSVLFFKINVGKSKAICKKIMKKTSEDLIFIRLVRQKIQWKDKAKYLRVTIDKGLTMEQHIKETINKARDVKKKLLPLIVRRSKLEPEEQAGVD